MDTSAHTIQAALQRVFQLRQQHAVDPALARASRQIKRFQARRFEASYADLLRSARYKTTAEFFLQELYGEQDYAERDQQFARIASTIVRLFPLAVVNTATALAQVHALTEALDDLMARAWLVDQSAVPQSTECERYIRCWRSLGDRLARQQQLDMVSQLGQELDRLTRARGLRTLLKVMRRPAAAAGLDSLQRFLETGFDAFAGMAGADDFLQTVQQRETEWIRSLFDDDFVACATKLSFLLAADSRP